MGATNKDKTSGIALAYIDSRDVMERLDDVVGAEHWQCRYPFEGCCEIGVDVSLGQVSIKNDIAIPLSRWVWKSNGAGKTDVEGDKGQYSDAFKRAAVLWGIGQYLYSLPNEWVPITPSGRSYKLIKPPNLPNWALPGANISPKVRKDFYNQVMECLSAGNVEGVEALWDEWTNDDKVVLWGEFNSKERTAMRKIQKEFRDDATV